MKKILSLKKILLTLLLLGAGFWKLAAQEEKAPARVVVQEDTGKAVVEGAEDQSINKTFKGHEFYYRLGAEYMFAADLPVYPTITFYKNWQNDILAISDKMIDELGSKGHLFRLVNQFEWLWDNNVSITAFANLTLNYIPAFSTTAFNWVGPCWKAALKCFEASIDCFKWGFSEGWLGLNAATLFMAPVCAFVLCGVAGAACLLAIPASVICLAIPMLDVGVSVDYHPFRNDFFDSKLSLGLDLDGYRAISNLGIIGFFTQAEASANIKNLRLYTQAGYRLDLFNIAALVTKTKENLRFVPAPYVRAGISYKL